jgi:crotonobetainyl-CoA:carnitine CoA-transferase CaiB-like acyl-CoA transferase
VIAQGESGVMDLTGFPDQPPVKLGPSLADVVTGLYAFQGILLALLARHRTGRGQLVDISLLDSIVSTLTYQAMIYLTTGISPKRLGNRHHSIVPYECYKASDGFVNIGVTNPKQWVHFCSVLGFPELATDPRFEKMSDRLANYDKLKPLIDAAVSRMTRAEVMNRMSDVGIPAGPVNTVAEILEDPQISAREMVVELLHPEHGPLRFLGIPIKLSENPGSVETVPPRFGEHNVEILRRLGYDEGAIAALAKSGAISQNR